MTDGYLFAVHFLHIVEMNSHLKRVLQAITTNGESFIYKDRADALSLLNILLSYYCLFGVETCVYVHAYFVLIFILVNRYPDWCFLIVIYDTKQDHF